MKNEVPLGKYSFCPVSVALPLPRMSPRPVGIYKADKVLTACSSHVRQKNAVPQKSDSPHRWLLVESLHGNLSLFSVPPSCLLLLISFLPLPLVQSWTLATLALKEWMYLSFGLKPRWKSHCTAGAGMWVDRRGGDSVYCLGTKAYWYFFWEISSTALSYAAQLMAARVLS